MTDCTLRIRVQPYLEGELPAAEARAFREHLAGCPRCTGACDALKRTVSMCKSIPGEAVPDSVRFAVRRAIVDALAR